LQAHCAAAAAAPPAPAAPTATPSPVGGGSASALPWIDVPPYQLDALVRGSDSLSKTKDGQIARTEF
jgi:hypothetical protein